MVGQILESDDPGFGGELTPINRMTVMASLRWDFSIHDARMRRERARASAPDETIVP